MRRLLAATLWLVLLNLGESFLFPILFPVHVKITFTSSHHKPPPPPRKTIHFESAPLYTEMVIKHSTSHPKKQSYGDGHSQHSSYGDGHTKIYFEEPQIKEHKYASGYGTRGVYHRPVHSKPKKTHTHTVPYGHGAYPEVSHPPVAPPTTYEEYADAHKHSQYPPSSYSEHYSDRYKKKPQYDDDSEEKQLTAYYDPGEVHIETQYDAASEAKSTYKEEEPLLYAGFGSTFYGDSYAKIVYKPKPKPVKLSISTRVH